MTSATTYIPRTPLPDAWRRDAACQDLSTSLFFSPDGERESARRQREAAAKAVCERCPVQMPCALYALATRQPYGVWGGLTEDDRVRAWTPGVRLQGGQP